MDWSWLGDVSIGAASLGVLALSIGRMFAYLEKRDEKRRSLRPERKDDDESDSKDS